PAGPLRSVDHRHADAVLHAVRRVEELQLPHDLRGGVIGYPPQAHQRRVPDERSEEHTSELQSLTNLVCRLLPEKSGRKSMSLDAFILNNRYELINRNSTNV